MRHIDQQNLTIWLVTSRPCRVTLRLFSGPSATPQPETQISTIKLGSRCYIRLLQLQTELPLASRLGYEICLDAEALPATLCYPGQSRPFFTVPSQLNELVHGSCRHPHHASQDSLPQLDKLLAGRVRQGKALPDLLLFSGDQIYADDVASPMLDAIHQLIPLLGLHDEQFQQAPFSDSQNLYRHPFSRGQRHKLLPQTRAQRSWLGRLSHRPIFSAKQQHNHLISLAEFTALYLLVWSPSLWRYLELSAAQQPTEQQAGYQAELEQLSEFISGLAATQRLLAHLPTYMIFDDHDITDDWNLTAQWQLDAQQHPLSNQIIGNALFAYWLFQGWGNQPDAFPPALLQAVAEWAAKPCTLHHRDVLTQLNQIEQWGYQLATQPKLLVLDTRTRRWWSERNPNRPSGLMDWEALIELHQQIKGEDAVIMVSAAPIFGVKLIEVIQMVFTAIGKPLAVDAENWMAHSGSAQTLLSIFKHPQTPRHFVILSGDVHYSFAYDIRIRFRKNSPRIWQITASGIKNSFPPRLLKLLDHLNRWLFASDSVFNLFTQRRRMEIASRIPSSHAAKRLVNTSGIGFVTLDKEGKPSQIRTLTASGEWINFRQKSLSKKKQLL